MEMSITGRKMRPRLTKIMGTHTIHESA